MVRIQVKHGDGSEFLYDTESTSSVEEIAKDNQVIHNKPLSIYVLRDHIRSVENAFAEAYSLIGFSNGSLQNLFPDLELIQEPTIQLWWAGKELEKGKKLCDYIGKNEKTKVVIRLQSPMISPASITGPHGHFPLSTPVEPYSKVTLEADIEHIPRGLLHQPKLSCPCPFGVVICMKIANYFRKEVFFWIQFPADLARLRGGNVAGFKWGGVAGRGMIGAEGGEGGGVFLCRRARLLGKLWCLFQQRLRTFGTQILWGQDFRLRFAKHMEGIGAF
nr:UPF0769 protein C21orf59 homolog [Ipomoea batatas]